MRRPRGGRDLPELDPNDRLEAMRERARRDVARFRQRDTGSQFWRSLGLLGSVGWPIVLLATGGAWFGRYLDGRLGTDPRFTLMLLTLGTAFGSFVAFRALHRPGP